MTQPAADGPPPAAGRVAIRGSRRALPQLPPLYSAESAVPRMPQTPAGRDELIAFQTRQAAELLDSEILQALATLDSLLAVRLADAARSEGITPGEAVRQALGDWIYHH